jgi:hypothetical protein
MRSEAAPMQFGQFELSNLQCAAKLRHDSQSGSTSQPRVAFGNLGLRRLVAAMRSEAAP